MLEKICWSLGYKCKEILYLCVCVSDFSVERLFSQLVEGQHSALEPLIITRKGVMSVNREFLFDPKALYALFYIHG